MTHVQCQRHIHMRFVTDMTVHVHLHVDDTHVQCQRHIHMRFVTDRTVPVHLPVDDTHVQCQRHIYMRFVTDRTVPVYLPVDDTHVQCQRFAVLTRTAADSICRRSRLLPLPRVSLAQSRGIVHRGDVCLAAEWSVWLVQSIPHSSISSKANVTYS
jgi:hypothetical protein